MNVGLTGGIACGKSTVSRMFSERGAHIVDADVIAREVVLPGRPALAEIARRFGDRVLQEDGSLNRKRLGEIVFGDDAARADLEAILHPVIRHEMRRQIDSWNDSDPNSLVIVDIPLLYESGLDELFAFEDIIVVYVPRSVQLERLMLRDGLSRDDAEKRLLSQMPIEDKKRLADVVIDNSGALGDTERQIEQYMKRKGF
ncbi:dephospho-CoA kinase [Paenibacillus thermotolerans]|uniref:dephospho-CoA kinase n=1 Tax=Paenibacillus thermotolerans TaxID=3027807 RepID=UPI002367ECB1|nr:MULTISPECIES: dephospho-CoA kinase [unclassified Paenibacillus]